MQYTVIFKVVKKMKLCSRIVLIFFLVLLKTLNIGTRKDLLGEAVLTSTHNECFGSKRRKICIPLQIPFFFCIKVGFKGVYISRTCFPDVEIEADLQ